MSMKENNKVKCQVCGFKTLRGRGNFEVCPVCFWEDEGEVQDPSVSTGGPNGDLSIEKARRNYRQFGAVSKEFVSKVRKPLEDELD